MPAPKRLNPADPAAVADALAFALIRDGRKHVRDADQVAAIVASELVEALDRADFVFLQRPPRYVGGSPVA
jgi:hypothetical protein